MQSIAGIRLNITMSIVCWTMHSDVIQLKLALFAVYVSMYYENFL